MTYELPPDGFNNQAAVDRFEATGAGTDGADQFRAAMWDASDRLAHAYLRHDDTWVDEIYGEIDAARAAFPEPPQTEL